MKTVLFILLALFFYGCGYTKNQYLNLRKIDSYKIVNDIDALCKLFPIERKNLAILPGTFSKESDKTIENFKRSIVFGYFYQGNFSGPIFVPVIRPCSKQNYRLIIARNAYNITAEHVKQEAKGFLLFTKEELDLAGLLNNGLVEDDICVETNINKYSEKDKIDHFKINKEEFNRALEELENY